MVPLFEFAGVVRWWCWWWDGFLSSGVWCGKVEVMVGPLSKFAGVMKLFLSARLHERNTQFTQFLPSLIKVSACARSMRMRHVAQRRFA